MRALLAAVAARIDAAAGGPVTAIACDTRPLRRARASPRAPASAGSAKHTNLIAPGLGSFVFLGESRDDARAPPDAPLRKTLRRVHALRRRPVRRARYAATTRSTRRAASPISRSAPMRSRAMRAADRRLGLGLRSLPGRLSADARSRRSTAGAHRAARSRNGAARPRRLLRLRSAARSSAGIARPRSVGAAPPCCGATPRSRSAMRSTGRRSAAARKRSRSDPHPLVRGHAAWALGRIGSPRAISALRRRRDVETRSRGT